MLLRIFQNSQESNCARASFLKTEEALARVLRTPFFQNTFFQRTPPVVAFRNER